MICELFPAKSGPLILFPDKIVNDLWIIKTVSNGKLIKEKLLPLHILQDKKIGTKREEKENHTRTVWPNCIHF